VSWSQRNSVKSKQSIVRECSIGTNGTTERTECMLNVQELLVLNNPNGVSIQVESSKFSATPILLGCDVGNIATDVKILASRGRLVRAGIDIHERGALEG
jgi:hypothetical protein